MSEYYEGPSYGIRDRQRDAPAHICPRCQGELFRGETIYTLNGEPICPECFKDWVHDLLDVSPGILAARLGIEVSSL